MGSDMGREDSTRDVGIKKDAPRSKPKKPKAKDQKAQEPKKEPSKAETVASEASEPVVKPYEKKLRDLRPGFYAAQSIDRVAADERLREELRIRRQQVGWKRPAVVSHSRHDVCSMSNFALSPWVQQYAAPSCLLVGCLCDQSNKQRTATLVAVTPHRRFQICRCMKCQCRGRVKCAHW